MCGFAGVLSAHPPDQALLARRTATLQHRGPDGSGAQAVAAAGGRAFAGLGHRRLAITDLTERGAQPMADPSGRFWIVSHGEVHNAPQLRTALRARGVRFRSRSDAEVLAALFAADGPAAFPQVNGGFACAVFDAETGELTVARDRFGEKPLYYAWTADGFVFGSEARSVLEAPGVDRALDPEALDLYLAFGFVPAPWTLHRGVRKLPHGSWARVTPEGLAVERWHDVRAAAGGPPLADGEALDRLRVLVEDAVRLRLVSDRPAGAFLAGGRDSSLVVGLMARAGGTVRTLAVGFEGAAGRDGLGRARRTAERFGTDHREVVLTVPEVRGALPAMLDGMDEPLGDPAALPAWLLGRAARSAFAVALVGDGADALFGHGRGPGAAVGAWVRRLVNGARRDAGGPTRGRRLQFDGAGRRRLLGVQGGGPRAEELVRGQAPEDGSDGGFGAALGLGVADGVLAVRDRSSMAHGLEVRCPFLDHRVVETALRMPAPSRRARGRALAEAFHDLLPSSPRARSGPRDFAAQVGEWFQGGLLELFFQVTLEGGRSLLDPGEVVRLHREHAAGRADHGARLWSLFALSWWAAGPWGPRI
jgi:asparagine synthase (glutamine-hydrolysing)